jgi:hypothetical protein
MAVRASISLPRSELKIVHGLSAGIFAGLAEVKRRQAEAYPT